FGPQAREVRDARMHQVTVDADATDTDVSPEPGRLFHLAGTIACDTTGPVIVTLSSETGRHSQQTACMGGYKFEGLAPASYEVFAVTKDGGSSGFIELFLDRDSEAGTVQLMQRPTVEIEVRRAGSISALN